MHRSGFGEKFPNNAPYCSLATVALSTSDIGNLNGPKIYLLFSENMNDLSDSYETAKTNNTISVRSKT